MINHRKMIGIKFTPDRLIQALIKTLPNPRWSEEYQMVYILNSKTNLDLIHKTFKGHVWINYNRFYANKPSHTGGDVMDVSWFRRRKIAPGHRPCPEDYLLKLELKRYANSTVKTYVTFFEQFINYHKDKAVETLDEQDVRVFLQHLIQNGQSNSSVNQAINAIKFYYEVVQGMPNRFYEIERPRKESRLPKVISKEEVLAIIEHTNNIKHRCVVQMLYSAGLRRNELLNLKLSDIDSKRMLVRVEGSKGNKDRLTLLSRNALSNLRKYYIKYEPETYLFVVNRYPLPVNGWQSYGAVHGV
jgi:integrase